MMATVDESANEFQRAKNFWQTRAARSQSQTKDTAAPLPPAFIKRRSGSNATEPEQVSESTTSAPSSASSSTSSSSVVAATMIRAEAVPKPKEATKSFAKRIAPFSNASLAGAIPSAFADAVTATPVAASASAASAPSNFRPSIVPAQPTASESPATPAPDHTMPATPSPSIEPARKPVAVASITTTSNNSNSVAATNTNVATTVVNSMFKTLSENKLFGAAKSKATGASMRSLSFANISSSWKSMAQSSSDGSTNSSSNGSPKKGASPSAAANAKLNTHNPSQSGKPHGRAQSSALTTGSPYGELVVVEILAAKDLSVGDFVQGESDPFVVVRFDNKDKSSCVAKATLHPVYNERFVFWVPSSPAIDQQVVSVTVRNKNLVIADEHLGEVHLSLAIPVNEAFDEWYPLVREDGSKKGSVRVGVRRMVLTSPSLLLAAQSLAAQERSLSDDDLRTHGATIPELWYGFAEAQEPVTDESKLKQTDVLASKLNHFSRRFIGIELTSSSGDSSSRRDVF